MPEPLGRSQRYMPGLDGIRALAVAAVIGYHLGVSWLPGGLLGVGIFFTLSGYLITDLLLATWEATGHLGLRNFWARRARLLPALFVMLAIVATWAAITQPSQLSSLRGQVVAAGLYFSNWWAAFQHVSYFARFGPPSPLGHLWSLAIEEQFYLLWPWLLLLGLFWLSRRRRRPDRAKRRRAGSQIAPSPDLSGGGKASPALEFAFAGAGAVDVEAGGVETGGAGGPDAGPGLRLLGSYVDRASRMGELERGGASRGERDDNANAEGRDAEAWGPAGPDLLALGNLLTGRTARATAAAAREPFSEGLYWVLGVPSTRRRFLPLAWVALALAAASALEMAVLYHPSFDPSRIYDGTDTRAFALLVGAALAMVWPSAGMRKDITARARRALDGLGLVGLVVAAVLICTTGQYSAWLYRGGMALLSVAAAAVVASAAHPATRLGRLLGMRPLKWLGVRSYGVYLWHYPVIVLTAPSNSAGFDLPHAVLQVGATLVLAELSWRFVESPVRSGALGRAWKELRLSPERWSEWLRARRVRWVAVAGLPACVAVAAVALAGAFQPSSPASNPFAAAPGSGGPVGATTTPTTTTPTAKRPATKSPATEGPATGGPATSKAHASTASTARPVPGGPGKHAGTGASGTSSSRGPRTVTSPARSGTAPSGHASHPQAVVPGAPAGSALLRTSCKQVVHIGDSTSASLISSDYLPDPAQRLEAEYARVGVSQSIIRIEGGTSVVETLPGEPNAYQMAEALVRGGYKGCWVVALGTNDAADVYVGSSVDLAQRVRDMMSIIGSQPVLWVNVKTLVASGPYAEANMRRWDEALVAACPSHPDMAVFNWAGVVQRDWFTSDGIHYNSPGSAKRAAAMADALATAFPAGGPSGRHAAGCTISASPSWDLPDFQY